MDNFEKLYNEFMDNMNKDKDDDMGKGKGCGCGCGKNNDDSGSSTVFAPVCSNAICNIPRMDTTTMVAEGHGTIANEDPENCGTSSPEIAFKFFIGKKFSKHVGSMSLVNYGEETFITSEKLECYHSPDHTSFVAIFHVEGETTNREVALFVTTQICNNLPTLFVYSSPACGNEEIAMGGSVSTGTITIAKKSDDDSSMGH